ncbi:restin homolog isoform X2 [Lytechinus pictus]|uniref:restin homolog isoform X2 n=1 Tax=Lytechinus pictus TaxID=7653 RepID=UPI0030B9EA00
MDPGKVKSLLNFVNSLGVGEVIESLHQLKDGRHFISMIKILSEKEIPDCDNPMQCYRFILKYLEGFYQSSLKFLVDFSQIVNGPSISEVAKVTALLLCAAIQSEKVKIFVDAITELDLLTQNDLKEIIQYIVVQESSHKLRTDFADILHRRGDSSGDSSRGVLTPMEPGTPVPRTVSSSSAFSNSPMSPVHNLINSPYMVSKLNNRRLHDRVRSLESKIASETALRQDLEAEIVEKNSVIGNKDSQLRELNQKVKELNKLKDEVDELQAVQAELQKSTRENTRLRKLLEQKAELKTDNAHLEKENKELHSERQELKHMMKDHSAIKNQFEETRVRLRRSELNLGELHRENCRLTDELECAMKERQELTYMMDTSQQMYKEKIALLEEQLMQASTSPVEGESLGIIAEQRVSELELELEKIRMTWIRPEVHQKMKSLYEEACQTAQTYETKLKEIQKEYSLATHRMSELEQEVKVLSGANDQVLQLKQEAEAQLQHALALYSGLQEDMQKLEMKMKEEGQEREAQYQKVHELSEKQNNELKTKIDALLNELEEKGRQTLNLETKMKEDREKKDAQFSEARDLLEKLQSQNDSLNIELVKKEQYLMKMKQEGEEKEAQYQKVHELSEKQNKELKTKIDALLNELEEKGRQTLNLDTKMKEDQEKKDAQLSEARDLLEKLQSQKDSLNLELVNREQYLMKMKQEGEEKEAQYQKVHKLSEKQNNELKTKIDALLNELEEKGRQTLNLETKMKEDREKKDAQFSEARDLLEKLQSQNDSLNLELVKKEQYLMKMKQEGEEKEAQYQKVHELSEKQNKELKSKIDALLKKLEENGGQTLNLETKMKEDQEKKDAQFSEARDLLEKLQSQNDSLNLELVKKEQNLMKMKQEGEEKEAQYKKVHELSEKQNKELETKIDALLKELEEKGGQTLNLETKMKEDREKKDAQFSEARDLLEKLQSQNDSLNLELVKKEQNLMQMKQEGEEKEAQYKKFHELSEKQNKDLKTKIDALLNDLEGKGRHTLNLETKMKEDREKKDAQFSEARDLLEKLQSQNDSLNLELIKKEQYLQDTQNELQAVIKESDSLLQKADARITDLECKSRRMEQDLESGSEVLRVAEKKIKEDNTENELKLKTMGTRVLDLQRQNHLLKQDLDKKLEDWLVTEEKMKQEKEAITTELGQASVKIEMLEQKYSSLKEDLDKEDSDLLLRLRDLEVQKREVDSRLEKTGSELKDLQKSNWVLKQNVENKEEHLRLVEEKLKREGESQVRKAMKQVEELQQQNGRLKQDVQNMHDILETTSENKKLWEEKIKVLEEKSEQDEADGKSRQHRVADLEKEVEELRAKYNEARVSQHAQEIAFSEQIERLRSATPNQDLPSSTRNSITDITPPGHPDLNLTHDATVDHSVDSLDGLAVSRISHDDSDLRMDDLQTDHDLRAGSVVSLTSTGSVRSTRSTRSRTRIEITLSGKRSESRSTSRSESHFDSRFDDFGGSLNSLGVDFPDNVARTLDELEASSAQLSASNRRDTLDTHRTTGPSGFFLVGCGEEEPAHIDWEDRLAELQRRNTLCRPHLRTSYPVETQTRAPKEITETDLQVGCDTRRSSLMLTGDVECSTRSSTRKRKSEQFDFKAPASKQMRNTSSCQEMPPPPPPTTKTTVMTRKSTSQSSMPQTHLTSSRKHGSSSLHVHNTLHKSDSKTSLGKAVRNSPRLAESRATSRTGLLSNYPAGKSSRTNLAKQTSRSSLASTTGRTASQNPATQSSRPSSRTSSRASRSSLTGSIASMATSTSTLKKSKEPELPEIDEVLDPRRESIAYSVGFSPRKTSRRRRSMRFSKKGSVKGSPGLSQMKKKVPTPQGKTTQKKTPQKKTPSKMKSMARFFGK